MTGDMKTYVYQDHRLRQDLAVAGRRAELQGLRARRTRGSGRTANLLFLGTEMRALRLASTAARSGRQFTAGLPERARCATSPSTRATTT